MIPLFNFLAQEAKNNNELLYEYLRNDNLGLLRLNKLRRIIANKDNELGDAIANFVITVRDKDDELGDLIADKLDSDLGEEEKEDKKILKAQKELIERNRKIVSDKEEETSDKPEEGSDDAEEGSDKPEETSDNPEEASDKPDE